jgi:hypothetical protein
MTIEQNIDVAIAKIEALPAVKKPATRLRMEALG